MAKKVVKDIHRIWWEDGQPLAIMFENGHDEIYTLKKATKADKDELFETENADQVKK